MNVRVGWGFGGPLFAGAGRAAIGAPIWAPSALLRDLALRLGLPPIIGTSSERLPRWVARIKSLGDESAFYAKSFAVDELGTAEALLEWRDGLVEAGWCGRPIPDGGARLEALAILEAHELAGMPLGGADLLVRVELALANTPARIYESIALAEDIALWPRRWQAVFRGLERSGTSLKRLVVELPSAPADTDLGLLKARLRGEREDRALRGDGTVLALLGDTPADLAELTAALLAKRSGAVDVVVRCQDAAPLEAALARHGLPSQGSLGESVWRPAMQILALAIELAFEPRDPVRLLELLTLPVGPLRGGLAARLAKAVARQPGIGGKEWLRQKEAATARLLERYACREREGGASEADAAERARALVEARWELVAAWLEGAVADPRGAPRAHVIAVVERVREWLRDRLREEDLEIYGAAYAQAGAFAEALANDTREVLSQEEVRQLFDRFARTEQACSLSVESAGRVAHVSHPAGLLAPCDGVFLWGFVAGTEQRPARLPWNDEEREALGAAGISFPDPVALLRAEAERWRGAVLAARERVVFVVPRTVQGTATAPHPLWDEACARLGLDDSSVGLLTREVRHLLDGTSSDVLERIATLAPLLLPEPRALWRAPAELLRPVEAATSVTALETMVSCPLAWVLERRAGLRSGALAGVAKGPLLYGGLVHRLVEELHAEGAFDLPEDRFTARAAERFEALLRVEGATLLVPGASIERLQLTSQVGLAIRELHRYLARAGYRVAAVEEVITVDSAIGPLEGRLDLRLVDDDGSSSILDIKWGASSHRSKLEKGRAVQLAAYAQALAKGGALPPAAYFAAKSREHLTTDERMAAGRRIDGPPLAATWRRVEATATAVLKSHDAGVVYATGTRHALALLDALGVGEGEREDHFETERGAGCEHCQYDALCGRKWEALS